MKPPVLPLTALTVAILTGCAGSTSQISGGVSDDCATAPGGARYPLRAERLTAQAADLMDENPQRAEELLREALTADSFHGPAHNNLGVLHLQRGDLFEAAQAFQWARKLMPGHPDPRLNLALTFERAGRIDEALTTYDTALEVHPDHMATVQAVVRCQLRHGRCDDRTDQFLRQVALHGETDQWRQWAQRQLAKR